MKYNRFYVGYVGNISSLIHGGGVIYRDKYVIHLDFTMGKDNIGHNESYDIYSCDIEDNVLTDLNWVESWWVDSRWYALAISNDIMDRAQAYYEVAQYYGPEELDSYPVQMTRSDLHRYRRYWEKVGK